MKDELLKEFDELEDDLIEAVLIDCNPKNWNGYAKKPIDLSREERGNRAFDLKNADKAMSIYARLVNIRATHTKLNSVNAVPKDDEEIKKDIEEIKKETQKRLNKLGLKVVNN